MSITAVPDRTLNLHLMAVGDRVPTVLLLGYHRPSRRRGRTGARFTRRRFRCDPRLADLLPDPDRASEREVEAEHPIRENHGF